MDVIFFVLVIVVILCVFEMGHDNYGVSMIKIVQRIIGYMIPSLREVGQACPIHGMIDHTYDWGHELPMSNMTFEYDDTEPGAVPPLTANTQRRITFDPIDRTEQDHMRRNPTHSETKANPVSSRAKSYSKADVKSPKSSRKPTQSRSESPRHSDKDYTRGHSDPISRVHSDIIDISTSSRRRKFSSKSPRAELSRSVPKESGRTSTGMAFLTNLGDILNFTNDTLTNFDMDKFMTKTTGMFNKYAKTNSLPVNVERRSDGKWSFVI